jgi:hypothetical protein
MPRLMTDQDIEAHLSNAQAVDSHEHGSLDGDEYFTATLYKTPEHVHFRYIDSAGMTSEHSAGTGEWLDDTEVRTWIEF